MRKVLVLGALLATFAARGGPTNTPAAQTQPLVKPHAQPAHSLSADTQTVNQTHNTNAETIRIEQSLQAQPGAQGKVVESIFREPRPNEIVSGKFTYSGIGVELVKTRNPLQMINPLAPPEYGSPEDNVVRDVITRKVTGLKFFAIQF